MVDAKNMLLWDTDINAAGGVLGRIILSWRDYLPEDGLTNLTASIAAEIAYVRNRHIRSALVESDLASVLNQRTQVNRALYRMFKSAPMVPEVYFTLPPEGGAPTPEVRARHPLDVSHAYEDSQPIQRPPGRPRLMTRADLDALGPLTYAERRKYGRRKLLDA